MPLGPAGDRQGQRLSEGLQGGVGWNGYVYKPQPLTARFLSRLERVKALGVFEPTGRTNRGARQHGHTCEEKDEVSGKQAKRYKDHTD